MPEEYTACFLDVVQRDGFVPAPGDNQYVPALRHMPGELKGSETADDDAQVRKDA